MRGWMSNVLLRVENFTNVELCHQRLIYFNDALLRNWYVIGKGLIFIVVLKLSDPVYKNILMFKFYCNHFKNPFYRIIFGSS